MTTAMTAANTAIQNAAGRVKLIPYTYIELAGTILYVGA